MNIKSICFVAATLCSLLMQGAANATVYTGLEIIGGSTIHISITTDGVTGALAPTDITSFDISVTGTNAAEYSSANGARLEFYSPGSVTSDNGHLTATPTALSFKFAGGDSSGVFFQ